MDNELMLLGSRVLGVKVKEYIVHGSHDELEGTVPSGYRS
jgi:hypothetical protein